MTEEVLDWKEAIARVLNKRDMYVKLLAKFIETERDTPSKVGQALKNGKADEARALNERLMPLHEKLFIEANPIPVKWALQQMGLIDQGIRLPLTWLSESCHETVRQAMRQTGILN